VQGGDAVAFRTDRNDECTVVMLDRPGSPAAAVVLDRDERLELSLDGGVASEPKAQAVLGLRPPEAEALTECEPALALSLEVRVRDGCRR